jgi:hypothetical protein
MLYGWHGTSEAGKLALFFLLAGCSIAAIVCVLIGLYVIGLGIAVATACVWWLYKAAKRQDQKFWEEQANKRR